MSKAAALNRLWHREYTDVLGLDIGGSGIKAVRLRLIKKHMSVVAADLLPAISLLEGDGGMIAPLVIPKALKARHVALAVSGGGSQIKLLSFPAHSEKNVETHILELMGLANRAQYRIAYESLMETRVEVRVLAVALPESLGRAVCKLFPAATPAPCSIEVSGLASMTAFSKGPGLGHAEGCVAVLDFGYDGTMVSFFSKGVMVLVRKLDFGVVNILKKLQENLGVDQTVATDILNDGSFDVSRIVHQAMEPFLQQLIVSWDFVERRENVHIKDLYACGGGISLRGCAQELEVATGQKVSVWNPFESLTIQSGAWPESLKGQESRFSAALGAAAAVLGTR